MKNIDDYDDEAEYYLDLEIRAKKRRNRLIAFIVFLFIIRLISTIKDISQPTSNPTCHYAGCNNPIYSYKDNLNGYCEKHKQEYILYKAREDAIKYYESIQ